MTIASNIRPSTDDLAISPQELKDIFLFGISLTDDAGKPFPEQMYEFYIRSAQEWVEKELGGLQLCKKAIVNETHDYYINDYISYSFMKLFRYPVLSVESVGIQFPLATNVLEFDPSWYRIESSGAQVNLVPTQGTFSSILLSQGGSFLPLLYQGLQHVPGLFRINYTAGFEQGKIPTLLKEVIGMKAAMGPLNIAGDLVAGAGIASKSLSLDGLSQSIGTTASATNAGYGARILQYNKEVTARMKHLREYYTGVQFVVA
jgi:hypothetical protein